MEKEEPESEKTELFRQKKNQGQEINKQILNLAPYHFFSHCDQFVIQKAAVYLCTIGIGIYKNNMFFNQILDSLIKRRRFFMMPHKVIS